MNVLIPFNVTDDTLTSINIPEDDYAVWDGSTTYARGDFAISTDTHSVYMSLEDSNLDNDPDVEQISLADPLIDDPSPQQWSLIGATNRWRLFDQKPSRASTNPTSMVIELSPTIFIGGIAGFNIEADSVQVEIFAGADKIYDRTDFLRDESAVADWLSYFTSPFVPLGEFLFTDLPILGSPRIVITLTSTTTVSVGQIVIGEKLELGRTLRDGTSFSGVDYSYIEIDEFGDLTTVQRPATRVFDINMLLNRDNLFSVLQTLNRLRGGIPAVWIANENPRIAAIVYGHYRGYREIYTGSRQAEIALEIQGRV